MNSIDPNKFYDTHIPYALIKGSSPYEIGLQHGQAAQQQIAKSIEIYSKLYKESKNVSWEEAKNRSVKFKPLIETRYPEFQQEIEGIAAGSGHTFDDILTLNVRSEITLIDISDGCTSIAQRSKETGEVFVAQNWDWIPEVDDITIFLEIHQVGKPKLLILAEAGIVGKYGFNSDGLAIMLNAISSSEVDYNNLPVHFALRKALESKSVDDLINTVHHHGIASAANFLAGDSKKYLSLEVTPKGIAEIYAQDEFGIISHTNHLLNPQLSALLPVGTPILDSNTRLERIRELNNNEESASAETFKTKLWDLSNQPSSILRMPNPNATGLARCITLYTIIINTTKVQAQIAIGPAQNKKFYKLFFS